MKLDEFFNEKEQIEEIVRLYFEGNSVEQAKFKVKNMKIDIENCKFEEVN
jgi:hypothetical protein